MQTNAKETGANAEQIAALKNILPSCFDKNGDFKSDEFARVLSTAGVNFSKENYALSWLGKSYARLLANEKPLSVLRENTEFNAGKDSANLLIKGDNLEALKHLKNAYYKAVKMIYIDPPYNTGDDFIYKDDRKFTAQDLAQKAGIELDEAAKTLEFNARGSNSHSAWLTFMYPRLYIARSLLKDDGVIFISIDDNEQAQLKMLCDEIFGEANFVGDFIRKTKSTTNDAKTGLNYQHEFLLCYAKSKPQVNLIGDEKDLSRYTNPDNDPNGAWVSTDPSAKSGTMENGYFAVTNPYTGKVDYPPEGRFWLFSQKTIQKHIDEGRICFKKEHKENERGFIYKRYLKDLKTTQKTLDSLKFTDNEFMNQNATKGLLDLGLGEYFSYPKGVNFMRELIKHATTPNSGGGKPRKAAI